MGTINAFILLAFLQLIIPAFGQDPRPSQRDKKTKIEMKSGYAPVNALKLYYEIHGARIQRVLRWSYCRAADTIKTSCGQILPELARNRIVIAFEQQGLRAPCRHC